MFITLFLLILPPPPPRESVFGCHLEMEVTIKIFEYFIFEFYIHGSVHRNSILVRSNKMQQYAGIYLLQNYSTWFGCLSPLSSGVHKTVTAASGTSHITI